MVDAKPVPVEARVTLADGPGEVPVAQWAATVAEERLRLLVESLDDAVFMLDPTGVVLTWNAGAQRMKGWSADEIVGRHFSVFYPPEDRDAGKPQRELEHARDDGHARDEGWRLRKDGSTFWASVVLTAVHNDQGRLEGFAKVTRDDTLRRLAEQQSRDLAAMSEREEIARGLLDTVVHRIFEAALGMEGTLESIRDPAAAQRIREAVDILDGTLKEIRTVALGLQSPDH